MQSHKVKQQSRSSTMAQAMKKEMAKKYTEISSTVGGKRNTLAALHSLLTFEVKKSSFAHDTDTFYAF